MGATANSKSTIKTSPQLLFLFKAVFSFIGPKYGNLFKHSENEDHKSVKIFSALNFSRDENSTYTDDSAFVSSSSSQKLYVFVAE